MTKNFVPLILDIYLNMKFFKDYCFDIIKIIDYYGIGNLDIVLNFLT